MQVKVTVIISIKGRSGKLSDQKVWLAKLEETHHHHHPHPTPTQQPRHRINTPIKQQQQKKVTYAYLEVHTWEY